jgi:hypothetical protein
MSLESLMPKIEKCGKGYDSCNQCPYASTCDIFDKNALIADCLAALEGRVIAIEDLPTVEEIAKMLYGFPDTWINLSQWEKNNYLSQAQSIRALIESKAEVK